MDSEFERISAFTLNRAFGYEPGIPHSIIDSLGSAGAVFAMSDSELDDAFGRFPKIRSRISRREWDDCRKENRSLEENGYQLLAAGDESFPAALRECPDSPLALYVRSGTPAAEVFSGPCCISVVGTRDISPYGREWCERIVNAVSFCATKPAICSGLAIGVDITAHLAALDSGLPTIAVLPNGIDDVYPPRHFRFADRIANSPGSALITDFPPGTGPQKNTFLRRNRIIAGLSSSTILIESKIKGGGMMTARLAFGYGRNVFALPGRIDDERSQGCNELLRRKIAEPLTDPGTVGEALGLGLFGGPDKEDLQTVILRRYGSSAGPEMLARLKTVALAIRRDRGSSVEHLAGVLGLRYADVSSAAALLESDGIVITDLLGRCSINPKIM